MNAASDPRLPDSPPDAASPPRLTIAVLARDEQDVLGPTLENARSTADELLVLDTGSTDRTRVVAYRYGAKVVQVPWTDDFSAARNRGLDEASGQWVLWLDAGERLAEGSGKAIREFLGRADPAKVYMIMVELPPADPQASCERIARPRLVPKRPDLRYEGRVRETLQPAMDAAGMTVEMAPGRILCHPRRHDKRWKALRSARNLQIAGLENAGSRQPSVRLLLAMGDAFSDLNEPQKARAAYLQAAHDGPADSTEKLEAYYGLLTTYDGDPAGANEQLAMCLHALEAFPLDSQLLCALGNYLQARGQVALAGRAFETAMRHGQINLETWHLGEIAQIAAVCLGLTLQIQKKDDEALAVLEEAAGESALPRIARRLIDLYVKRGRLDEALQCAARLGLGPAELTAFQDAVRGAFKAAANESTAALGLLQSAYAAGCRDPLCLRWLAMTLLAGGQVEAAEPVLRDWQTAEPGNPELRVYLEGVQRIKSAPASETLDIAGRRIRIDPGAPSPPVPIPAPAEAPARAVGPDAPAAAR